MKNQVIIIGAVVLIILAGVGIYKLSSSVKNNVTTDPVVNNATTTPTTSTTTSSVANTFTLADVAQHTNAQSCWTAINGGVYDVTAWIKKHPGGQQAILSLCGKDGSAFFNGQHGGQRRPASELATFKIGTLVK